MNNKYYYSDGTTSSEIDDSKILHREDGPAIEFINRDKHWFINGKRHRADGPAIEWSNGAKEWWINDKLHREDGPAFESKMQVEYWLNNKRHRADGPASEYSNGAKVWWVNGKLHREDGPACEYSDGSVEYYLNGKRYLKKYNYDKAVIKLNSKKSSKEDKYYYSDGTISSVKDYSKVIHRADGPAIEWSDGTKFWCINGKRHREDGPAVECSNGTKTWYINGKLHRENGPAVQYSNGIVEYWLNNISYSKEIFDKAIAKMNKPKEDKYYYFDGTTSSKIDYSKVLHRVDGPAVERSDGTKFWCINGKFHREDGPAIEYSNGDKQWYINGEYHREDGPAIQYSNGIVEYWLNNKRHREDGPAVENNGYKAWWVNGKLHREDGPAREFSDGTKEYWLNNISYSKEIFDKAIAKMNKPKKDKYYYSDGTTSSKIDDSKVLHREDGPAVERSDGTKHWLVNGKLHREDGPACEFSNGSFAYFMYNKRYSKKEYEKLLRETKSQKLIASKQTNIQQAINRIINRKITKTINSIINYKIKQSNLNKYLAPVVLYIVLSKFDKTKSIAEESKIDLYCNLIEFSIDKLLPMPKEVIEEKVTLLNEKAIS